MTNAVVMQRLERRDYYVNQCHYAHLVSKPCMLILKDLAQLSQSHVCSSPQDRAQDSRRVRSSNPYRNRFFIVYHQMLQENAPAKSLKDNQKFQRQAAPLCMSSFSPTIPPQSRFTTLKLRRGLSSTPMNVGSLPNNRSSSLLFPAALPLLPLPTAVGPELGCPDDGCPDPVPELLAPMKAVFSPSAGPPPPRPQSARRTAPAT